MSNYVKNLEVFIITNGRSTFEYCKKSIEAQHNNNFMTHIIKNKKWLEAHKEILSSCKAQYALRVDDDMFLHPLAISFILQCLLKLQSNIALRGWRLWEPWSNKICKGIKVYHLKNTKKIGFTLDHLGKIDKPFSENAKKNGYSIEYSRDIIGIHACGNFEEHLRYWEMRGESRGSQFMKKAKWAQKLIDNFSMSLEEQYKLSQNFLERLNIEKKTQFGYFIKNENFI